VATALKAEESREHNPKSAALWGVRAVRTCLSVHGQKVNPRRANMQAARFMVFFLKSCSGKVERTKGLENSESERKQF